MGKRYQVFVSSTFADLKDERSNVIQTLMEMDCIPAGMELFPALDEEQFEFIKKVIDDSDYYLLIIGGRYGSLSDAGISYTEMEYDYAISKGVKVIALVHGSPEKLAVEKVELDSEAQQKLQVFKQKVTTNRLVKFWDDAKELSGLVALSLPKTIKAYPAVGWVRANQATDNTELLKQLNELRQEKDNLEKQVQEFQKNQNNMSDLAQGEDKFTVILQCDIDGNDHSWEQKLTWDNIFKEIGEELLSDSQETEVFDSLSNNLVRIKHKDFRNPKIRMEDFKKIKFQLLSLNYIEFYGSDYGGDWAITPKGKKYLLNLMAIKRNADNQDDE